MMSREQTHTPARQSVRANKQTEEAHKQADGRSGGGGGGGDQSSATGSPIGSTVFECVAPPPVAASLQTGGFFRRGPCVRAVWPPCPPGRMRAFSERESVHVWDVTQTRAAQHSRLFKGPFILLQLVQLLKTDKQDLELRAAENRPPTPLLKPLRPGPTLHCDWEKKTNKSPQTGRIKVHGESSAK